MTGSPGFRPGPRAAVVRRAQVGLASSWMRDGESQVCPTCYTCATGRGGWFCAYERSDLRRSVGIGEWGCAGLCAPRRPGACRHRGLVARRRHRGLVGRPGACEELSRGGLPGVRGAWWLWLHLAWALLLGCIPQWGWSAEAEPSDCLWSATGRSTKDTKGHEG